MNNLIRFKASEDLDTMYYHKAMRAPDREHLINAIIKEVENYVQKNIEN